jgi:hypothetical protein
VIRLRCQGDAVQDLVCLRKNHMIVDCDDDTQKSGCHAEVASCLWLVMSACPDAANGGVCAPDLDSMGYLLLVLYLYIK